MQFYDKLLKIGLPLLYKFHTAHNNSPYKISIYDT